MEGDVFSSDTILEPEKCTTNNCIHNTDQQKLHCITCKRHVHLRCTLLPPYQLQRFLTFAKGYCTYICANCVEIPEYLQEISLRAQKEVFQEKYEQELQRSSDFKKEITSLNKTIRELKTKLHTMVHFHQI